MIVLGLIIGRRANVEKIFIALLKAIGERHIKPAYDA